MEGIEMEDKVSFSDKFDDKLCQLVLSYLPLKDKARLECVSKQFERTIYKSQRRIVVEESLNDGFDSVANLYVDQLCCNQKTVKAFQLKAFKKLVKKCTNVRSFVFQSGQDERGNGNGIAHSENTYVIHIITKHLTALEEIDFNFNSVTLEAINAFVAKFGHSLRKYGLCDGSYRISNYDSTFAKLCPQLTHLNLLNLSGGLYNLVRGEQNDFKQLKHLAFWLGTHDNEIITTLFDNNINTLESIDIYIYNGHSNSLQFIDQQLAKLSQLKSLRLDFSIHLQRNYHYEERGFPEIATESDFVYDIGVGCPLIDRLDVRIQTKLSSMSATIFESIKFFPHLKRLHLMLRWSQTDQNCCFSSDIFKDCPELTHLWLDLPEISEKFFEDIDKNLERVEKLELSFVDLSRKCIQILAKLRNLMKVVMFVTNDWSNEFYTDLNELTKTRRKLSIEILYELSNESKAIVFKH